MAEPARHERFKEVLFSLEGWSASERSAWMARHLADDPALIQELERWFAEAPPTELSLAHRERVAQPADIGPFRPLRVLGRGGSSVVWEAERRDSPGLKVALKVLREDRLLPREADRFQAEFRHLARLAHPHVARVIEAGVGVDGRPWIAMELVNGPSIVDYARTHRLGARDRIQLFCGALRGVLHAHRRGILHRDLKASNVLVQVEGEEPRAKVIDFGLAKPIELESGDQSLTLHGEIYGTLGALAPERWAHEDADVRSDVWSLGVILHQLLTGQEPFGRAELQAENLLAYRDWLVRQRIDETVFRAALVRELPEAPSRLAARELAAVVAKALAGLPDERYESALEFLEDLERWLEHRPVQARPMAFSRAALAFIQRRRVLAASLATALISAGIGAGFVVDGWHRLDSERSAALGTADRFEEIGKRLRNHVLVPRGGPGRTLPDILLDASMIMRADPPLDATVRASLGHTLGEALFHAAHPAEARHWLQAALTAFEGGGLDPRVVPDAPAMRFHVHTRLAILDLREGAERNALEHFERAFREVPPELVQGPQRFVAAGTLADLWAARGELNAALKLCDEVLAAAERTPEGRSVRSLLRASRAGVLERCDRLEEAQREIAWVIDARSEDPDRSLALDLMLGGRAALIDLRLGQRAHALERAEDLLQLAKGRMPTDGEALRMLRAIAARARSDEPPSRALLHAAVAEARRRGPLGRVDRFVALQAIAAEAERGDPVLARNLAQVLIAETKERASEDPHLVVALERDLGRELLLAGAGAMARPHLEAAKLGFYELPHPPREMLERIEDELARCAP